MSDNGYYVNFDSGRDGMTHRFYDDRRCQRSPSNTAFFSSQHANLQAICPPSTNSVAPVMYDADSEARNSTAWATSSGLPPLPSGICFRYGPNRFASENCGAVSRV